MKALKIAATGMTAQQMRVEVISNNLANMSTTGYNARRAEFADAYPDELKVGGWEFEVFSPSGENLAKDTTACRECHHPLTDTEFMWSIEHLTQKPAS